jgi:hypothetical protein
MKSKTSISITLGVLLLATLALPVQLAAQHIASGTNGQITFTQGVLDFNGGAPQTSSSPTQTDRTCNKCHFPKEFEWKSSAVRCGPRTAPSC